MSAAFTLVTGGSNGIGGAICRRLMQQGAAVINVDKVVPADRVDGDCRFMQADLSNPAETRKIATEIAGQYDVIGLVNNAGVSIPGSLDEVTEQDFIDTMNLHLQAAIVFAQAVLPGMTQRRYGRIVNMSSRAALGKKARTIYGGSKAALIGMTRTWALELGSLGITVNAVAPGPIVTDLFQRANSAETIAGLIRSTAVGRAGTPDDVADAVMYFLSPASSFVTGQVLHVCGGASLGSAAW